MIWRQSEGVWFCISEDGWLLGKVAPVSGDPRIQWHASVLQNNRVTAHGGYLALNIAKAAVEHFAGTQAHAEDCGCPACLVELARIAWESEGKC